MQWKGMGRGKGRGRGRGRAEREEGLCTSTEERARGRGRGGVEERVAEAGYIDREERQGRPREKSGSLLAHTPVLRCHTHHLARHPGLLMALHKLHQHIRAHQVRGRHATGHDLEVLPLALVRLLVHLK